MQPESIHLTFTGSQMVDVMYYCYYVARWQFGGDAGETTIELGYWLFARDSIVFYLRRSVSL